MKKIGLILSGCGVYDGAEIHETVLTMLAIDRAGAQYVCFAPNEMQHHVINHVKGEPAEEKRNMMVEAARIARGEITALADADLSSLDALILPGGFGAAKNLCDYAFKGSDCTVREDVKAAITKVHEAGKPVGAMCIAPAIIAKVFGDKGVEVTIGSDEKTAGDLQKFGAKHVNCSAEVCHVDEKLKIVTAPAYMCAGSIKEAAAGIEKLVAKVIEMA